MDHCRGDSLTNPMLITAIVSNFDLTVIGSLVMLQYNIILLSHNPPEAVTCSTAQKTKFSIKDFFSKCDQTADLVTITEDILKDTLVQICFTVCSGSYENNTLKISHY